MLRRSKIGVIYMIVDKTKMEVLLENPFEILRRQIAFFGKTEEHTKAVYLKFLEEDGYRADDYKLTFYSFKKFEPNAELEAFIHFEEDRGIIFKKNCFKIILGNKFYELVEKFNNFNVKFI